MCWLRYVQPGMLSRPHSYIPGFQRPHGLMRQENFRLITASLPPLQPRQILVKTLVLSLDPVSIGGLRAWVGVTETVVSSRKRSK